MDDPYFNPVVPDHVPKSLVHDHNLFFAAKDDLDVFESIRRMQQSGVPDIFWTRNNGGHWVVLRGEWIPEAYKDTAHFSSRRMLLPDEQNFDTDFWVPLMADPPAHTAYRAIAAPLFSAKRVNTFEKTIAEYTDRLVGQLKAQGQCEFMNEFALQMPVISFLRMLELPDEDRLPLLEVATRIVQPPREGEPRDAAVQRLFGYLRPIIESRRASPGDDVISKIVTDKVFGRALEPEEMLGVVATVLVGGLDTVASTLGFVMRFLADNPGARDYLRNHPEKLEGAVEEFLRRFAVTNHGRTAAMDYEFHGVFMKKGEHIHWGDSMYNLDARLFPTAMEIDFDRKREPYMTFGTGAHFCIGMFLARMEIRLFIQSWLKFIPNFSLSGLAELRPGWIISYKSVPLQWES